MLPVEVCHAGPIFHLRVRHEDLLLVKEVHGLVLLQIITLPSLLLVMKVIIAPQVEFPSIILQIISSIMIIHQMTYFIYQE